MKTSLTVLVLKNNWHGVYNAFETFYDELIDGLNVNKVNFFIANTLEEAKNYYETQEIAFSIYVGVYNFIDNGEPLYDKYKVLNYQWVIDNPYVYKCLPKSKYNRLIMIDEDFYLSGDYFDEKNLVLSLGAPEKFFDNKNRINAILVPWRLKNYNDIREAAKKYGVYDELSDFLNKSNLKLSFHKQFNEYLANNKIENIEGLFRVANDYFRLYKRIELINSIKKHKLIITSETPNEDLKNNNVKYIKPLSFDKIQELQRQYKFVLNANPNYDNCLHDRISHAVANGAVVISDNTPFLKKIHFPSCFDFDDFNSIDDYIDKINKNINNVLTEQRRCIENFKISNQVRKIIENYNKFK